MSRIQTAARWLFATVFVVFVGWIVLARGGNVGKLLNSILGRQKPKSKAVLDEDESVVGRTQTIIRNSNPLRDKSRLQLSGGGGIDTEIELPEGVEDSEVESVVRVDHETYAVRRKHDSLTSVFDSED